MRPLLLCIVGILACSARANAQTEDPRPGPYALIDRPLVLPRGYAQITEELSMGALKALGCTECSTAASVGVAESLSFDVGIGHRVQLGAWFATPLNQDINYGDTFYGSFVPRVTVELHHDVALRVEAGFDRSTSEGGSFNNGFVALALSARWRVHRMVMLSVGDTGARSEWPIALGHQQGFTEYDDYLAQSSHAVLAIQVGRQALTGPLGLNGSFGAPLSVLFQPHRLVALQLITGLRANFYATFTGARIDHFATIPLQLDVVVTPHRLVDLGLSVNMPIATTSAPISTVEGAFFVRVRL